MYRVIDYALQEIEATLHCITSIQEAIDMENTPHLPRVFGPEILGRLPSTSTSRIRRTTLGLIGAYSSWFASQPPTSSSLLMSVLTYVASALTDPALCLQAAIALRNLCDANRKALAPEIGAFGQLHAALGSIPESEKSKVVQSIASVIQALPAHEQIEPITAIVDPIARKLAEALQSSSSLPDESRTIIILELETLSGLAKGLTRTTDGLVILGERDSESDASLETMQRAKEEPRVVNLRKNISDTLEAVVNIWSTDAGISSCNLIQRSSVDTILALDKERLLQLYGRRIMKAVIEGFASVAPRSVVPNLIEILGTLLSRAGGGLGGGGGAGGAVAANWIREILFADDFIASKATREVKESFATAIL
ncbi:hypothetical protein C0992_003155, partial [Termitomyces sp. T32_za158]